MEEEKIIQLIDLGDELHLVHFWRNLIGKERARKMEERILRRIKELAEVV